VWLSVDRLAEKYPTLSPYNFVANNPLRYVDPNGDSLFIQLNNGTNLLYENGTLYDQDGNEYKGKLDKFGKAVFNDLNKINSGENGANGLRMLEKSENSFYIKEGSKNEFDEDSRAQSQLSRLSGYTHISGTGGTVMYNSTGRTGGPDVNGNTNRDPFVGLAHELGHALNANVGMSNFERFNSSLGKNNPFSGTVRDELDAMFFENLVRQDHGIPLRAAYGRNRNGSLFMPVRKK